MRLDLALAKVSGIGQHKELGRRIGHEYRESATGVLELPSLDLAWRFVGQSSTRTETFAVARKEILMEPTLQRSTRQPPSDVQGYFA